MADERRGCFILTLGVVCFNVINVTLIVYRLDEPNFQINNAIIDFIVRPNHILCRRPS